MLSGQASHNPACNINTLFTLPIILFKGNHHKPTSRRVFSGGHSMDIENKAVEEAHLQNTTVKNFAWQGITVTVKDRVTKEPKSILRNVHGAVHAGNFQYSQY
jgi:hypothetical protein